MPTGEETDLLQDGEQDLQDDEREEYDGEEEEGRDDEGEGGQEDPVRQDQGQVREEEEDSRQQIAALGPFTNQSEIDDLAADLGVTPAQFNKLSGYFGRIAAHNMAGAGIGNAHLANEVNNSPGLRSRSALIARELAGIDPQRQSEKKVVQWAIASSFIVEAKPEDTWQDIAKRIAKSAGLSVSGSAPQSRQDDRTEPRRAATTSIPTPPASGASRVAAQQQAGRRRAGSGAAAFLASRTGGLSGNDIEVMRDEISGRRRAF
jgi:hypothetical protein